MAYQLSMLLVDDEVNVAHTLRMVFEDEGYFVTVAHSAAEALAKLTVCQFQVVITDLNLERENVGLQVARAAKNLRPQPIVVICTGYADVANLRAALDMKVDYVALKPVSLVELVGSLDRLLSMRRGTGK
jgi:CheY-like chemotaxis protein